MQDPRNRPIRLLIVDDVPDTAQNVQKLLYFEHDIQVVGVAVNARDAIAKANALRPDVILMDINMPDMDGLRATEIILRQVPTRVVIMSVQGDKEYLDRAMMAGARGFLVKPFSGEDLINKVRAAARVPVFPQPGPQPSDGGGAGPGSNGKVPTTQPSKTRLHRMIAVYSPKGGVGRSVIAANLAVALKGLTNSRVALVDADLQSGDAHVLLNINAPNTMDDLREAAGGLDAEVISDAMAEHESGVELLRAPVAVESAERFTADATKAILVELREHFDYLIIDTDDALSEATLTVLEMADQIVLVTTLEVTTINKVTRFLEVLDRLGFPEEKVKLVCNRVDTYYGIRPSQVETQLHHRFICQIPEDNRLVVTSVNRGIPFVLAEKRAGVSRSVGMLADRIAAGDPPAPAAPERGPKTKGRNVFGR